MRSVVLSGFMATGKSTLGARLAARLGLAFVDSDVEIERVTGKSVAELWRADGEAAFRAREVDVLGPLLLDSTPRQICLQRLLGQLRACPDLLYYCVHICLQVVKSFACSMCVNESRGACFYRLDRLQCRELVLRVMQKSQAHLHAFLDFRRGQARARGDYREVAIQALALAEGQVHISCMRLPVI